jgi:hypothetical protein
MRHLEKLVFAGTLLALAEPAFAGTVTQVPAPIVGVGLGAVALIGLGYRALKSRINP